MVFWWLETYQQGAGCVQIVYLLCTSGVLAVSAVFGGVPAMCWECGWEDDPDVTGDWAEKLVLEDAHPSLL
jgi:hypothetical protein